MQSTFFNAMPPKPGGARALPRQAPWVWNRFVLGLGLLLLGTGSLACSTAVAVWHMPAGASRKTPPLGLEERALAVGTIAPEFSLPNARGATYSLKSARAAGPVILVFYRGFW